MRFLIYCGPSLEDWGPESEGSGIGGSEEAVINMGRELTKLGHSVTVYNQCKTPGTFDGVEYLHYEDLDEAETDVLVVWRMGSFILKHVKNVKAKKKILWLHDMVEEVEVLPFIHFFDTIFVLSKFHRANYPNIPDGHFVITNNGVNLADFKQRVKRDPHTIVYGSSYDRGLKDLLENWTKIKVRIPDAKLKVFYGWDNFDKNPDTSKKSFKDYIEHLMDQDGIEHLGRISHKEVARHMLSAGIWAYPTWWPETNCITAQKAQVGGAVPVVIPSGSLREMVKYGWRAPFAAQRKYGYTIPEQVIDLWGDAVVEMLRDTEAQEAVRKVMIPKAKELFSWEATAKQWEELCK
jgi:glycosyltransferase involved in cell wall biosynthesis